jgi:hypothetical protein
LARVGVPNNAVGLTILVRANTALTPLANYDRHCSGKSKARLLNQTTSTATGASPAGVVESGGTTTTTGNNQCTNIPSSGDCPAALAWKICSWESDYCVSTRYICGALYVLEID